MKCPNKDCGYTHGWTEDDEKHPEHEEHGEFLESPVKMEQSDRWGHSRRTTLYACPRCKIAFIGD